MTWQFYRIVKSLDLDQLCKQIDPIFGMRLSLNGPVRKYA